MVCVALAASVMASGALASGPRLSESAYRAKATAICVDLNRYQVPATKPFVDGMQGALEKTRSAVSALAGLEPPVSLVTTHQLAIQAESKLVADFAALLARVRNHTLTPQKMIAALGTNAHARSGAVLWRRLGVPACAQ